MSFWTRPLAESGAKNKELYIEHGNKAVFQGGEKDEVADVFFHGYSNYEKGLNAQFLKLTSCNTTGLIRTIDCLDRGPGVERVAITIVRRVADPGDYHRGIVNALQVDKAPNHQAVDLMTIMPHVDATGLLVHTPITHGHFISVLATPKDDLSVDEARELFEAHDRIRVVSTDQGFLGNASIFKYARDLGFSRGDIYEVPVWEDTLVKSGRDIMFGIHIPQESVTIPESIDGVRAAMAMETGSAQGRRGYQPVPRPALLEVSDLDPARRRQAAAARSASPAAERRVSAELRGAAWNRARPIWRQPWRA